jgi:hypothetical protein
MPKVLYPPSLAAFSQAALPEAPQPFPELI